MTQDTRIEELEATVQDLQRQVAGLSKALLEGMPRLQTGAALPPNLIRNSWMDRLAGNAPAGFEPVRSELTLEAVHPYTKGFDGVYAEDPPALHASNIDAATAEQPFWFGTSDKGPRVGKGGLASGSYSFGNGRILKVTGDNSGRCTSVGFPFERNVLARRVRFTAWLKIAQGRLVCSGSGAGFKNEWRGHAIRKETTERAPDGWYRVNAMINTWHVTSLVEPAFANEYQRIRRF